MHRKITNPILILTEFVNKIGDLDFVCKLQNENILNNKDETGIISKAIMSLREELRKSITEISSGSMYVKNYSENINSSTKEAVATEEAESSIEEQVEAINNIVGTAEGLKNVKQIK